MVILAAETDNNSNTALIGTDQTSNGVWYWDNFAGFILKTVVIKLIAPRIEEAPAKCMEKMVRSAEAPTWPDFQLEQLSIWFYW